MKITEMHFKTITVTDERHGAIQNAIIEKGGHRHGDLLDGRPALFLNPGGKITTGTMLDYIESRAPEVPYAEALRAVKSSEAVPPGKWLVIDVDASGNFKLENPGRVYKWWDWARALSDVENRAEHFMFGGWLWNGGEDSEFTATPYGESLSGCLTASIGSWVRPSIPVAIRFWIVDKK